MKIKNIVIALLIISGISGVILYSQAAQPKTSVEMILKSIKNVDSPQLIRELISHIKESLEKDTDHFPDLIAEIDSFTTTVSDPATKAVLHSMLAQMYKNYYQSQGWIINQRTSIEGYIPEDIQEWSANLFERKIREELEQSLQPATILQQTPVNRFQEIIESGKDSPELRPTLYDFLAYRALMIQPSASIFEQLIEFRKTQPEKKALLLAELDYLQYNQEDQEKYELQLDSLQQVYAGEDYSVEIVLKKLENLTNKKWRSENQDSISAIQYALAQETLNRFPDYERIGIIRNWLQNMETPSLNLQTQNTVYPGDPLKVRLNYNNVKKVQVSVYESLKTPESILSERNYTNKEENDSYGKLVSQQTYLLSSPNTYTLVDTVLSIPMEKPGIYECVVTTGNGEMKVRTLFSVSRLSALHRDTPAGKREVLVTDLKTGKPQENAQVIYYKWNQRQLQKEEAVKTDRNGLASLPGNTDYYHYKAILPGDTAMLFTPISGSWDSPEDRKENKATILLTDRGIYRPGQPVFFKGICYIPDKENARVLTGQKVEIALKDPNNKVVASQVLTTNEFGSFQGEFTLPNQGLTGGYQLTTDINTSTYIQVEEYKRPTFKVDFSPVTEEIRFGDQVTLNGKAHTFSGVNLQDGKVNYRITRRFWLISRMVPVSSEQVSAGSTSLQPDGSFMIRFRPERSKTDPISPQIYTYDVHVTITDSKGETQESSYSISVGDKRLFISTTFTGQEEKERVNPLIKVSTINNQPVTLQGSYQLFSLEEADSKENFREKELLTSGTFESWKTIPTSVFSALPSGRVRIRLEAKDSTGEKVEYTQDLVLYSRKDKRPPIQTTVWLPESSTQVAAGQSAEVLFGTSEKNASVFYEIFDGKQLIQREWLSLNNENRIFKIPFRETYGDWLNVVFTIVKEGQAYSQVFTINRAYPDKKLTIKKETFRDKLQPGSYETWKFKVLNADSIPVIAEVLASMYDASLDQFIPFRWLPSFEQSGFNYSFRYIFQAGNSLSNTVAYDRLWNNIPAPEFEFDKLDWQGMMEDLFMRGGTGIFANRSVMSRSKAVVSESADMVQQELPAAQVMAYSGQNTQEGIPEEATAVPYPVNDPSTLRTNFQETAFFYPVLQTDPEGHFVVSFNIPESNTTWKLQSLAHTVDLKYGLLTEEVITQKPFMILPNLPRFVRKGDVVSITTQLINQSEEDISGLARIELFDPATNEPVICLTKSQHPFTLSAGMTTEASWQITVPADTQLLGIRIIADSPMASDGEQHILPVLPDEILITESHPFYLTGEGDQTIEIGKENHSTTRRPVQMTLEISSNPVWYAVQALPTLTQPKEEDILSWFASYYSNTLATYLVYTAPRLQQIIQAWTARGGDANTLYSNLQKNEELKNILLEETPWVLDAEKETEQKQRLSLLFDLNRASQQRETALQELRNQQLPSGAWGWFRGFYPNRQMTIFILKKMGEMVEMGAMQSGETEKWMQMSALNYLDKCMQDDYEALRKNTKNLKNVLPTPVQLDYLYMRSFYRDIPEVGSAREAIRFYNNLAENTWEKASLYGKASTGILMYRMGKREVSEAILTWFRKTATFSPEMGMYWANNRRNTDFFVSPVDVHSMIMAFFREASPEQTETDAMKQWLLNQKRTQQWDSPLSTMSAIYSLLSTGSDWLNENNRIMIRWGEYSLDTAAGEIATGYIKETIPENNINSRMETLHVHKEGITPAWGAVYEQYFESIQHIEKQAGALHIEKKLFIEINSGTERQLSPVTGQRPLKVGDKVIVRLTVRTDREMEFVHLKDLRAGCFEPSGQLSGFRYRESLMYYQSSKDISEHFFFERLPVGTYVLEYPVYVSRKGEYSSGISTIQCLYAPEFVSHTEGERILVQE